jgi:tetratricopeptide (TPR) repeat protein
VNPERGVRAALVGSMLAGAAHCSRPHEPPAADAGSAPAAVVLEAPPTTAPSIALHNLDAEIADREKRSLAGEPDAPIELVGRYLMRAKFVGRVSDLLAADAASAKLVATRDGDAKAHLTRAGALSAIHEFASAQVELERAATLKAEAPDVARERASILLAIGREDEAAALLPAPVEGAPASELAMRGGIEARLGHAAESDRLFRLARERYRDVSPFSVAWLDFEHSRALELAGDRADARAYLAEAAAVMPTYAHAVVHLAALEPPERALSRLEALEKTSDDPDVLAGEADALRRAGRAPEAAAMLRRARTRFDEVLAQLPKAYADHAASFFLGMGADPRRALELARSNAQNRPTDEAVELWLTAAQAAAVSEDTCAAAAEARALAHATSGLRERAASAARGCP